MTSPVDGTRLLVDDQLSQSGTHIENAAQQIMDELSSLRAQLQPVAETWTGPAASYFEPFMQQWHNAAVGLFGSAEQGGVLGEIASTMNLSWNNYADAEAANAKTWSSGG